MVLTAGIFALIISGGFTASLFLFVLGLIGIITFGLRTIVSFIRTLNNQTKAKIFENIALGITAISFLGFGASLFIFPVFLRHQVHLGTFLLAFKIIFLTVGVLFSLATVSKIFFGSRANIYDSKIEIKVGFENEHVKNLIRRKTNYIGVLLERDNEFEEKMINLDDSIDQDI